MRCDTIWQNARLCTLAAHMPGLGVVDDGVIAADQGRIVFAGAASSAPAFEAGHTIDCAGRWITPGLIDCHTHLVHGGNRAGEFEMKLAGASYEDIARAGGGIRSTMRATRASSEADLVASALPRLDALIAEGATTVEVKSGYGLSPESEARLLRAARMLGRERPVTIRTTFLGAHAVPPEFDGDADGYIDLVCDRMLPAVAAAGLADAVDGFCEGIAFSPAQIERVFARARELGLPIKLHAEQLSNLGGAALAARHGALSADHLEHLDADGIAAMKRAGTVAVLLPGAFYFLRETHLPPIEQLRAAGVPIAIATDCNPGTSPVASMTAALNLACVQFRLTPEEALAGATRHAAKALGLTDVGVIAPGKAADLAVWDIERPAELCYWLGKPLLHARYLAGVADR